MHADMAPLAPFLQANFLLGALTFETLHWFCFIAGILGGLLIVWRDRR